MNYYAMPGRSDEWYTPKRIFDAMGVTFDLDVAAPAVKLKAAPKDSTTFVPCTYVLTPAFDGLKSDWRTAFVWMNPPFGGRNGLVPWLDKFFVHGNGVALTPDRTSAPWWQDAAKRADATLFIDGKVRFIRPDGTEGKSPGDGTTLFASGPKGVQALINAEGAGLGVLLK